MPNGIVASTQCSYVIRSRYSGTSIENNKLAFVELNVCRMIVDGNNSANVPPICWATTPTHVAVDT
jgi:hypothetical protein